MDFDGNQDQATVQEELNRQDDDVISPQTSKDDFLPGLPTPDFTPDSYVDDIVAICRRENVPKLQVFKEELLKKLTIARPQ